jgi:hypothetical protein
VRLPPLLVFPDGETGFSLWVAGGEHEVVDGKDYLVAQSFLATRNHSEGDLVIDEFGQRWRFTKDVNAGFSFDGIVLLMEG